MRAFEYFIQPRVLFGIVLPVTCITLFATSFVRTQVIESWQVQRNQRQTKQLKQQRLQRQGDKTVSTLDENELIDAWLNPQ